MPLGSLDSNNIAKGSMDKMFKNLSNCDLAIVALFWEEENEENQKSSNAEFGCILLGKKDLQKKSFPHFFTDSVDAALWSGHSTGFFLTSSISSSGFIAVILFYYY
jgi:hypothetical protein